MNDHEEENTQTIHHEAAKLEGEVYILLNNNNIYIGSTINIKHRLIAHKNKAKKGNNKLYTCMRDKGFDNFKHYTVEKITFTHIKELRQLEQYYLNMYKEANFNILNDNESCVNIEAKDIKEYDRLYRTTPKRQTYIKKYNKKYRTTDKYKNYLVNYRLSKRHTI